MPSSKKVLFLPCTFFIASTALFCSELSIFEDFNFLFSSFLYGDNSLENLEMKPFSNSAFIAVELIPKAWVDLRDISFFSFKRVISFCWLGARAKSSTDIKDPLEVNSKYLLSLNY